MHLAGPFPTIRAIHGLYVRATLGCACLVNKGTRRYARLYRSAIMSNQIHIDRTSIHTRAIAASTARYWLWAPVLVTTMLLAVLLFASTLSVI
jgi:hypothetical protein